MEHIYMRYPGWTHLALTFSYDDGVTGDRRMVKILTEHGMKGTFNINGGAIPEINREGDAAFAHSRIALPDLKKLYSDAGMEVALHGYSHPFLESLPRERMIAEIFRDREALEKIFEKPVRGSAYPYGTYDDDVKAALKACGIVYSRGAGQSLGFELPSDWLAYNGTCHHGNPRLMELADRFLAIPERMPCKLFYVWGHTYEFDDAGNWDIMERFADKMGGRDDVFYATNIEIYDYIQAYRSLVMTLDGSVIHNPTATEVFFVADERRLSIKPGETLRL